MMYSAVMNTIHTNFTIYYILFLQISKISWILLILLIKTNFGPKTLIDFNFSLTVFTKYYLANEDDQN